MASLRWGPASVRSKPDPSSRRNRRASGPRPGFGGASGSESFQRSHPARARWKTRWRPCTEISRNFPCRLTASISKPVNADSGGDYVLSALKAARSMRAMACPTPFSVRKRASDSTSGISGMRPLSTPDQRVPVRRGQRQGALQSSQICTPLDFDGPQRGQMCGVPLHIQKPVLLTRRAQLLNEGDQRDLRGVAADVGSVKHRLPSEQAADAHAVKATRQSLVGGPRLNRVHPAGPVQLAVHAANPIIDPATGTPWIRATVEDRVEMGVHTDLVPWLHLPQ